MKRKKTFVGNLLRHAGNAVDELMMACPSEEETAARMEEISQAVNEMEHADELAGMREYIVNLDDRLRKVEHGETETKVIPLNSSHKSR